MKSYSLVFFIMFAALLRGVEASAQPPHFRALAFYSTAEEPDHAQFAEEPGWVFMPRITMTRIRAGRGSLSIWVAPANQ